MTQLVQHGRRYKFKEPMGPIYEPENNQFLLNQATLQDNHKVVCCTSTHRHFNLFQGGIGRIGHGFAFIYYPSGEPNPNQ